MSTSSLSFPDLTLSEFKQRYWLKSELVQWCRERSLPTQGGKLELARRITQYLETGQVETVPSTSPPRRAARMPETLTRQTRIEAGFR
ncbi:MAG: hypothetical protein EOP09_12405 [Proteobacteria bacterium]|nr:MAG: hypothetical protein EOP09_12405 [Pseudomonadota bacterium]